MYEIICKIRANYLPRQYNYIRPKCNISWQCQEKGKTNVSSRATDFWRPDKAGASGNLQEPGGSQTLDYKTTVRWALDVQSLIKDPSLTAGQGRQQKPHLHFVLTLFSLLFKTSANRKYIQGLCTWNIIVAFCFEK